MNQRLEGLQPASSSRKNKTQLTGMQGPKNVANRKTTCRINGGIP